MDRHETTPQQDLEISQAVPDSLLSGVMRRLEERRTYLSSEMPVSELLAALADPRWDVRSAAVHTLGTIGEQVPLAALISVLHDEHHLVRVSALRALGLQGKRAPLEHILLALKDPEWESARDGRNRTGNSRRTDSESLHLTAACRSARYT